MHFVIVAACSAGGDGTPRLRLHSGGAGLVGFEDIPQGMMNMAGAQSRQDATAGANSSRMMPIMMPVAEAQAAESGTRLKARWYVAEDGARQFVNWFDSELQRECTFAQAVDGVFRCLPAVPLLSTVYFTNASCTARIVLDYSCAIGSSDTVAIFAPAGDTSCTRYETRHFRIGAPVQPTQVWQRSGATCIETAVAPSGKYYPLGVEIAPSTFVTAQVQVND